MKILALLLLTLTAYGQRTHPSMIITPDLLMAMKQRARNNTTEWRRLYGNITTPRTCQWAVHYTASTADHLPMAYAYREPLTIVPLGSVSTGDTIGDYQGGGGSLTLLNMGACYLTLKDGDVDLQGSPAGTADELASASLYAAQAAKIVDKFTYPYAKITPASPPAKWEGFTWMPAFYVDLHATDVTGCVTPGERRVSVYLAQHIIPVGGTVTITGVLGGLATLNGQSFQVSANGLTTVQFQLEQGGSPVCSSLTGTNYNTNYLDDDAYPLRYGMSAPALAYDWFFNHAAFTPALKAQVGDSLEGWFRHTMILDSSARATAYESHSQSNYHMGFFNAYGLAGIALKGDDARANVWYHHWRNVMLLGRDEPYYKRWLGNNGSFMESWQYFSLGMQMFVITVLADETALGDNLINHPTQPLSPFLLGQLEYLKQSLQPNGHAILQRNTTGYISDAYSLPFESNRITTTSLFPLSYLADRENSPLKNKFRKLVADAVTYAETATGYPAPEDKAYWSPFLFWESTGPMEAWDDAPLSMPNMSNPEGGYGHVFMRSDWTTGGVYGSFVGGPPSAHAANGKEMFDRGSLQVQRGDTHLLVNTRGECFRNLPQVYAGNQAKASAAMACYSMAQNQGANANYLASTAYGVFYTVKPGQQDGPLRYGYQLSGAAFGGAGIPSTPGASSFPDQVLPVTVDPATATFTITTLPSSANLAIGSQAYITHGDGLAEGAPPAGISRGVKYYVRSLSGSTFKLATTNSDTTIVGVTSAGSGPQFVVAGNGPSNKTRNFITTHPTKIDRYADQGSYVYSRAVNLHQMYSHDLSYSPAVFPMRNWTREILYLRPKVFVVYDRTTQLPKSIGTQKSIATVANTTPVSITTTANHGYHTGMTVTLLGSTVASINGTPYTIMVTSPTAFTLDGTTAAGGGTAGGTVSGTVLYQPTMAWTTGKTPVASTVTAGTRYNVSDGSVFKGAITTVLPSAHTTAVRDVGGYGMIHQIQVAAPMTSDTNNFLTVIDAADAEAKVESVTKLANSGIDAVLIGSSDVVGFLSGNTFPATISYTLPPGGQGLLTHRLVGFNTNGTYRMNTDAGGKVTIRSGGTIGTIITAKADGVLEFTLPRGTGASVVGTVRGH